MIKNLNLYEIVTIGVFNNRLGFYHYILGLLFGVLVFFMNLYVFLLIG